LHKIILNSIYILPNLHLPMKIFSKILLLLMLFTLHGYSQKDSLLIIKIGAGANYTNWLGTDNYSHNSYSHYSHRNQKASAVDTTTTAPTIRISLERKYSKRVNFFISENYFYSHIKSSLHLNSRDDLTYSTSDYQKESKTQFHHFNTALGTKISWSNFYFTPKLNLLVLFYNEHILEYGFSNNSGITQSVQNNNSKNKVAVGYGLGSSIGYDFPLKKHPFFIELGADYLFCNKHYPNYLSLSCLVGFRFY
jgi:hypothetical protein